MFFFFSPILTSVDRLMKGEQTSQSLPVTPRFRLWDHFKRVIHTKKSKLLDPLMLLLSSCGQKHSRGTATSAAMPVPGAKRRCTLFRQEASRVKCVRSTNSSVESRRPPNRNREIRANPILNFECHGSVPYRFGRRQPTL